MGVFIVASFLARQVFQACPLLARDLRCLCPDSAHLLQNRCHPWPLQVWGVGQSERNPWLNKVYWGVNLELTTKQVTWKEA